MQVQNAGSSIVSRGKLKAECFRVMLSRSMTCLKRVKKLSPAANGYRVTSKFRESRGNLIRLDGAAGKAGNASIMRQELIIFFQAGIEGLV